MAQEAKTDFDAHLLQNTSTSVEQLDYSDDEIDTDGARNGPGYVYLLSEHTKSNGQPTHFYKIGVSSKPDKRIADLQTGNPRPLLFQGAPIRVSRVISAEKSAHKAVAYYASSLGGGQEWFYVSQQDWEKFWNCYQKTLSEYAENCEGCTCRPLPTAS